MKQTTEQKIAAIEARLARLQNSRRTEQRRLQNDRRRADAHRKIELGGLLIACGVDDLNPGEIAGLLLSWKAQRGQKPEQADRFLEVGIKHLADRSRPASVGSAGP
jgi:hypothetical protein